MQGIEGGLTNSELRVRVQNGDVQRVLTFSAQQTVWIGRDATCDVVLNAQEVSRRHASLFVKDGALWVRDHSTYGTQVDGRPLTRAVRTLRSPGALELGPYRLEVMLSGEALELRVGVGGRWSALRDLRAWLGLLGLLAALAGLARHAREPARGEGALDSPNACPAAPASVEAPTVARAVESLRSGDRLAALHTYRALAARDESRAEFAIIASLLARELSCRP